MKHAILAFRLFCLTVLAAPVVATADVISDWNNKAVETGVKLKLPGYPLGRILATMHVAMFDAINAIEPRYTPYHTRWTAAPGASREAAAAAAAHYVLAKMFPDQTSELDAYYQTTLAVVPDGEGKTQGIQIGETVAAEMVALRAQDGADAPNTYRPSTTSGRYVPTAFPVATSWNKVTPFVLKSGSQFRPRAPYSLKSTQWAKDYNEIKAVGAKKSATRTAEQTETARFWEFTGPGTYNPVLQQVAVSKKLGLLDNARLFALFAMATADVTIATFDAKFAYAFWRPVTAIRNGDNDGNDATVRDAGWDTLIPTPMHPEYPCLHCSSSNAAAAVLRAFFGDEVGEFSLKSPTAPGVTHRFTRLSDYTSEVQNARVYAGVHYRNSTAAGSDLGRKVGEYVVQHALQPLGTASSR